MFNYLTVFVCVFFQLSYMPYIPISILDMLLESETVPTILHYVFCALDPAYLIFGGIYYIDKVLYSDLLPIKGSINSLSKKLYPHCLELVGSRNRIERDLEIKLKQIEGLMEHLLKC